MYSVLPILLQSTHFFRRFFKIRSSQIRVLRPLPSMNGWATFISTYLATISLNVSSGIRSIVFKVAPRKCDTANWKPPLVVILDIIVPPIPEQAVPVIPEVTVPL